jgi:hypothetical protein
MRSAELYAALGRWSATPRFDVASAAEG